MLLQVQEGKMMSLKEGMRVMAAEGELKEVAKLHCGARKVAQS